MLQERFNRWALEESLKHGRSSQGWRKYDRYLIEDGYVRPTDHSPSHLYFPMTFPRLPMELAKLAGGDQTGILDFVHQWGLLGFEPLEESGSEARREDKVELIVDLSARVREVFDTLQKIEAGEGVQQIPHSSQYIGQGLWGLVPP